jgi:hypothetical protein
VRNKMESALELVYLGGAIALVGVALYLTHGGEEHGAAKAPGAGRKGAAHDAATHDES